MRIQRNRYNYPPRWFGLRALVVDDHGLAVVGWLGITSHIPWTKVCGVRRDRHDHAQVELAGGRMLDLPGSGARLDALIDTLSRECVEAQAVAQHHTASVDQISGWLGLSPAEAYTFDENLRARWAGPLLTVLFGGPMTQAHGRHFWELLVGVVLLAIWSIGGWMRMWDLLRIDVRGVSWTSRSRRTMVYWSEVLECKWRYTGKFQSNVSITLTTRNRSYELSGMRRRWERIAEAAERIAASNTAEFLPDDGGVPQTGLSPARLRETGSERGLSQTFR